MANFLWDLAWKFCKDKCSRSCPFSSKYRYVCCGIMVIFYVMAVVQWGFTAKTLLTMGFLCVLYFLSLVDIYIQEIPDVCHLLSIALRLGYYFFFEGFQIKSLVSLVADGLFIALPLLLLTVLVEKILKKDAFGGGDIKLLFVTGLYLGAKRNLFMTLVACILGLSGYFLQTKAKKSEEFSFGPAIAVATAVFLFLEENVVGI